MSTSSPSRPNAASESSSHAASSSTEANPASHGEAGARAASGYEPPTVTPLGTLPESTGMPASPFTFPEDPQR
jgi:hypothetical protein